MQPVPLYPDQPKADSMPLLLVNHQSEHMANVTDDELMLRQLFAQDARKGCALLFRRYYPNLVNHAVRFVYSKEVAEDLVAEVFTVFWQDRTFEQITTSYRAYLYKAVRHRAYNYLRWELRQSDSLELADEQSIPVSLQPDQMLHYSELHQKIESIIQSLPPQCQRAFLLSRIEGKKYAEIAQDLQISSSAVEKLLIRALGKLRQELKTDWFISLVFWGSIGSVSTWM
ncbi:RNA polymerase sigma-70 factor [Spirosoma endophyticum]|uniref:RNA polymerase sigma-70 factor, ECF subfamily n=1 Tax=Spirosoma endophyticum TaxID=662367 RepID=A0A1I1EWR1_9BACT|nr:RNA polymerase sigma-70 factor [Spirosoma endophyticum]SFB89380.1 RNA polymerase sigma-70 factor, ECF subfamily [Spirosoma endophyticum]